MYSTLQFLVTQLNQRGSNTQGIIENTGINQTELDDPWPYLSSEQYQALVNHIYQLTDDPAIGLNLSKVFKIHHLGVVGFAAMTSQTFAVARKIMMQYRVLKDPYLFLNHRFTHNSWTIQLCSSYPADKKTNVFSLEGHIVRTARFCNEITGRKDAIQQVNLSYPAPAYAELYAPLLQCPVLFDQAEDNIILNHQVLTQELPAANARVFEICKGECDAQLSQLDENSAFSSKVYQELFRAHSQDKNALLNLIEVANRLYISPRTLRRKLSAESTSFKIISNDTRRDLAFHYLSNTALSTKEIAYALGYSSANNFHRAFKQWTGGPISDHLKTLPSN